MSKKLTGSDGGCLQGLSDRAATDGRAAADAINKAFLNALEANLYFNNPNWLREKVSELGASLRAQLDGGELEMNYLESADDL